MSDHIRTLADRARTSPDLVRQYLDGTLPDGLHQTRLRIEEAVGETQRGSVDVEAAIRCLRARSTSRNVGLQVYILRELSDEPRTVKELALALGEPYTAVSNSLYDLRYKGYTVVQSGHRHALGTGWMVHEPTRRQPAGRTWERSAA